MSILKTTLVAASIAVLAGSSAFAQQSYKQSRMSDNARAAYAASFTWGGYHPGNVASDTTREGLVATSQ